MVCIETDHRGGLPLGSNTGNPATARAGGRGKMADYPQNTKSLLRNLSRTEEIACCSSMGTWVQTHSLNTNRLGIVTLWWGGGDGWIPGACWPATSAHSVGK